MTSNQVSTLSDEAILNEVKRRVIEGQLPAQIAEELQLPIGTATKHYNRARIAITVEDYQLPPAVHDEVSLAYLNKILVNCGESNDPRANKIALGAASMIQKHPLVRNQRKAAVPNWSAIGEIGGDVPLDGLLETPATEEKKSE